MPTTIITKNGSGEPSADKLTAGELAVDLTNKRLYTKDNNDNILELGTNPGPDFPFPDQNGLTISDVAPLDPNEGDQWLNSDTAEVFIFDGAVWLEFPQGRDGEAGADGADGNIADGTQDGIVATWSSTANSGAGQWTPNDNVTIDNAGNATFSGTVSANCLINSGGGLRLGIRSGKSHLIATDTAGNNTDGTIDLGFQDGTDDRRWRDAYFSGTVTSQNTRAQRFIQDGSPIIDAKGLIKTLSTLRNATKDETTLEGLRDALADAIGGLIEDFEHQIATMPAPEPEVSTMPAGDES